MIVIDASIDVTSLVQIHATAIYHWCVLSGRIIVSYLRLEMHENAEGICFAQPIEANTRMATLRFRPFSAKRMLSFTAFTLERLPIALCSVNLLNVGICTCHIERERHE